MSKKLKVLVSVVVAVVLLTAGGTVMVMARDNPAPAPEAGTKGYLPRRVAPEIKFDAPFAYLGENVTGANMTSRLLARVATILGIPEEKLVSAFKQAQREMRDEAFMRSLDRAVEKGRMTQDQANKIKEWWRQKPEGFDPGLSWRARALRAMRGRHLWGQPGMPQPAQ